MERLAETKSILLTVNQYCNLVLRDDRSKSRREFGIPGLHSCGWAGIFRLTSPWTLQHLFGTFPLETYRAFVPFHQTRLVFFSSCNCTFALLKLKSIIVFFKIHKYKQIIWIILFSRINQKVLNIIAIYMMQVWTIWVKLNESGYIKKVHNTFWHAICS